MRLSFMGFTSSLLVSSLLILPRREVPSIRFLNIALFHISSMVPKSDGLQSFIGFFPPPVAPTEAPQPEVVLGHTSFAHLVLGQATIAIAEPDLAAILIQLEVNGDSVLVSRVRAGEGLMAYSAVLHLQPRPPRPALASEGHDRPEGTRPGFPLPEPGTRSVRPRRPRRSPRPRGPASPSSAWPGPAACR